ncbi:conserved hypothetical protein [Candidatus Desulfarcum epimagneticum]|uniref:Sulfotransferase family protein n=1 Tax=uncultured Desulfobacteraceae bacterium TaxID=218296 RepID=A0A484HLU6_9BACT|nr:conserved hypothetical protein [uncultured Desulfobacteraceae bacterium]
MKKSNTEFPCPGGFSARQKILSWVPPRLYLEVRRLGRKIFQKNAVPLHRKPFDEARAIFIHIPKCAGVSVNHALFGNLGGGHATLEQYLDVFEPKCIVGYFKFTIVRNPWDRLASAYHFLKQGGFDEKDRHWFNEELACFKNFDDFVRNWLSRENIWKWDHFRPQRHYMFDRGHKVQLDFVGRFENIQEDFSYIAGKIGAKTALPHLNKSERGNYPDDYTKETKERVAEVYAEDIQVLGYDFDHSIPPDRRRKPGRR